MKEVMDDKLENQKEKIALDSELYKHALEQQLSDISKEAKKAGKVILIAGAGAVATYLIAKKIFGKKKSKKKHKKHINRELVVTEKKTPSPIASLVKQQIAIFLMDMAKEKISEQLAKNKNESIQ